MADGKKSGKPLSEALIRQLQNAKSIPEIKKILDVVDVEVKNQLMPYVQQAVDRVINK